VTTTFPFFLLDKKNREKEEERERRRERIKTRVCEYEREGFSKSCQNIVVQILFLIL
jgi:hypothetical protein